MSVFNGERWLAESIQSVLNQTFTDFEYIIVNDGSIDGSDAIIRQFADKDPRIRVFDKINTGLTDSLNYGIDRARGDWIARIDADDLCEPQRFARQMELVQSDQALVLVGTGLMLLDQHGSIGKAYEYPIEHEKLVKRLTCGGSFFAHSSALFRTKVVRELGGYRMRFRRSQDRDLWLRLSEHGKVGCIKGSMVMIRKHDAQISHEEDGKRQLVDSHVAMVSYWLRKQHCYDPVQTLSDSEFSAFHDWIEDRLLVEDVFETIVFVEALRKKFSTTSSKVIASIMLVLGLISSPRKSQRWLREKFFGSELSLKLAKEWAAR